MGKLYDERKVLVSINMIRDVTLDDAPDLAKIYNYYIQKTVITFEEVPVAENEFIERIKLVTQKFPWLVCAEKSRLIGFAYANTWKTRSAYNRCVETSMYLDVDFVGRGIGTALYTALIQKLEERGIHSVIAGIAIPNNASIALHKKLGFEKIGYFKQVGWKFNQWLDVEYWERLL